MMVYQFREGTQVPATIDPQLVGERIAELRAQGRSAPLDIVEDARDEASPMHVAFTWDDGSAAQAHRLWQARHLVNSIRIVREDLPDRPTAPAFVSVVTRETGLRAYVSLVETVSDDDYRVQRLNDARSYFIAGRKRFSDLSDPWLTRIFTAVDAPKKRRKRAA